MSSQFLEDRNKAPETQIKIIYKTKYARELLYLYRWVYNWSNFVWALFQKSVKLSKRNEKLNGCL